MKSEQAQEKSISIENFISSLGISKIHRYPTEYRAACPFCQDESTSNPSFSIYFDCSYYCHACQKRGNKQVNVILSKESTQEERYTEDLEAIENAKSKIEYAKSFYNQSSNLSREQLEAWLKARGFNKTQIFECLQRLNYANLRLRYRNYKGEKVLVVPIIGNAGICGVERINLSRILENKKDAWNKKSLGSKKGLYYLPVNEAKATIITESLANAFVNALLGYNSLVTFGINNTSLLPDAVKRLQDNGQKVYYFPDSLGVSQEDETRESQNFMDVLKKSPGLLGVLWPSDVKKNYDVNDLFVSIFKDSETDYSQKEKDFFDTFQKMLDSSFTYSSFYSERKG